MPERDRESAPDQVTAPQGGVPTAAVTSAMAQRVLALQRSAGNAAVAGMIQRSFYEQKGSEWVWHPEEADEAKWVDTGAKHRGLIYNYPVYAPKPGEAPAAPEEGPTPEELESGGGEETGGEVESETGGETAAPAAESGGAKKKTRRGKRKKKAPTEPAPETVEKAAPAPAPTAPAVAPTAPTTAAPEPPTPGGDGGFTEAVGKSEKRKRAAQGADVNVLAAEVDGAGTADAHDVIDRFNRLFNALDAQGQLTTGKICEWYVTKKWDRPRGGFSIEVRLPKLANWVLHSHMEATGEPVTGEGATHYKALSARGSLGVSAALLPKQRTALIPDKATVMSFKATYGARVHVP